MARIAVRISVRSGEEAGHPIWERTLPVAAAALFALLIGFLEAAGALGLLPSGILVHAERSVAPLAVALSESALLLSGSLTLYLAWHLWMRKRAALYVFAGLVLLHSVLLAVGERHLPAAAISSAVCVLLILLRGDFPVLPDSSSIRLVRRAAFASAIFFYGTSLAILALQAHVSGVSMGVWEALTRPVLMAAGDVAVPSGAKTGYPWHLLPFLVFWGAVAWMSYLLFRPAAPDAAAGPGERQRARKIVQSSGSDTIAYFNLRGDKGLFFHGGGAFLAYRWLRGTALVSGDPVGPEELLPDLLSGFREYCMMRGWRIACLGASGRGRDLYGKMDMRSICYGEEAVIHLPSFTLEGRKNKTLRHAVAKWERSGARMEFMFNDGIPEHLRLELSQISADWRGRNPETGFSMGLGRLFSSEDPDCLLALAYDAEERPIGFAYMVPVYPQLGFSLDITRTSREAGNGINEFIFAKTALFLKERGYRFLSLHFAAFSHHYREGREEEGSALVRELCRLADRFLPVMSLYRFDRKFNPLWLRRYLVFESWLELPRVGMIALAAESFHRLNRFTGRA